MRGEGMEHALPRVGLRMVRSAAAVLICLLISLLINREEMRIYASIAALLCIQPYAEETMQMARKRFTGTVIGSAFGGLAILLEVYLLDIRGSLAGYLLIAAFIIPVLWTAVALKAENAAYFSCVVFLSITVTHITDVNPWLFVWHRMSETLVGILVGIGVSAFHLPRKRRRDTLFVSGLDGVLLNTREELTPYSRIRLNRMLDDGLLFTLSTMRTPASVREAASGLRFRLPIIVMDGAALYDMGKRRYLHASILPWELAMACRAVFEEQGIGCFINGLMDDVLLTYYGDLKNEAERGIYEKCRTSPYRNYVSRRYYRRCPVIYLMGIDRTENMQALYDALKARGLTEQVKIRFYPAADYPGFSFLKIYEKSASRQEKLELLKAELGVEKSVTFSTEREQGDVLMEENDGNLLVKKLARMYEPYLWEKA